MDVGAVVQSISNYGFPIIMCVILMWYVNNQEERYKTSLEKLNESLNNNTLALQALLQEFGVKK
jgi:hypothetical protein